MNILKSQFNLKIQVWESLKASLSTVRTQIIMVSHNYQPQFITLLSIAILRYCKYSKKNVAISLLNRKMAKNSKPSTISCLIFCFIITQGTLREPDLVIQMRYVWDLNEIKIINLKESSVV